MIHYDLPHENLILNEKDGSAYMPVFTIGLDK